MKAIITSDDNRILRISDGEGAYITLRMDGSNADLLSITVPEEKRRQGIGTGLLSAAESVLTERRVPQITVDYLEGIEGLNEFLTEKGFDVKKGSAILALDIETIRKNSAAEKLLKQKIPDVKTRRFEELNLTKWEEMTDYLDEMEVEITGYDLAHLDSVISSVIYDSTGRIQSVLLGSVKDEDVYVELLLSRPGTNSRLCTLAALRNMLRSVMEPEGENSYKRIIFASCNPGVISLIEGMQRDKAEPDLIGRCLFASKGVDINLDEDEIITETEEGAEFGWIRELNRIPMQRIIRWKAPWYRSVQ